VSDWKKCKLGDALTLQRGFDLPERERRPGTIPIISSSGITGWHDSPKVDGPGVVTGRYGTLGEVFYIDKPFWPLNTSLFVKDFKGNNPRFIRYLLKTLPLGSQNAAGAVPGLNRNHLHELSINVPPPRIQTSIAHISANYDDLIENNSRRIAILEEMARSLYREWFVELRIPGLATTSPARLPVGWREVSLSEVVTINPRVAMVKTGHKPFISMSSLANNGMHISDIVSREGNSGSKFQNGDTLFARITPCIENGKTAFVQFLERDTDNALGSTEFIVMRGKSLSPEMVYLLARTDELRAHAIASMTGASGRQRVAENCFDTFKTVLPPARYIEQFTSIVRPMFKSIHKLALASQNLRATRDLLLPKLISGELDVSRLPAPPAA
jgi:type I restriction enzyme, S subunit